MLSPARSPDSMDSLPACSLSPVSDHADPSSVAGLTGGEIKEVLTGGEDCQAELREAFLIGDLPHLEVVLRLHEPPALTCKTCGVIRQPLNVNVFHPQSGQTPLHLAILQGNLDLVDLLIRCGANQWLANKDGWPPLHVALWSGCHSVATRLLRPPLPQTPQHHWQALKFPTRGQPFILQHNEHEHFNMPPTPPASPPMEEDRPPPTTPHPMSPLDVKPEPESPPRSPAQCWNPSLVADSSRTIQRPVCVKEEHVEAEPVWVKDEPVDPEESA